MPCISGFPTRLEDMEWVVAGAELSSAPPIPTNWSVPPDTLYCEVAPRTKIPPRPVPPVMSLGLSPCQVGARAGMWRTRGVMGHWETHDSSCYCLHRP